MLKVYARIVVSMHRQGGLMLSRALSLQGRLLLTQSQRYFSRKHDWDKSKMSLVPTDHRSKQLKEAPQYTQYLAHVGTMQYIPLSSTYQLFQTHVTAFRNKDEAEVNLSSCFRDSSTVSGTTTRNTSRLRLSSRLANLAPRTCSRTNLKSRPSTRASPKRLPTSRWCGVRRRFMTLG